MENTKTEITRMYNLAELEPILNVSYRTLLRFIKSNKLKAVKIGGQWKVSETNLIELINGK